MYGAICQIAICLFKRILKINYIISESSSALFDTLHVCLRRGLIDRRLRADPRSTTNARQMTLEPWGPAAWSASLT